MEMAEHHITVNAYAPGIVGTAMWDLIDEKLGEKSGVKKGDTIKKYTNELIAMKRTSTPEVSPCRYVGWNLERCANDPSLGCCKVGELFG